MLGFKCIMYRSCHVFIGGFDCLFMLLCSLHSKFRYSVSLWVLPIGKDIANGLAVIFTSGASVCFRGQQGSPDSLSAQLVSPPQLPFLSVMRYWRYLILFFSKNVLQPITNHKIFSDYNLFMPNIRKIETKPVVKKGMLEIEAKVIDDILTRRPSM